MDIDGEELSPEREDITLSHVDFSYDSKLILHDVSLAIPEKTTVAIVGPSGSGKTTLQPHGTLLGCAGRQCKPRRARRA